MFDYIKANPLLWIVIFLAVVAPSFLFGAVKVVAYIVVAIILLLLVLGLIFRVKIVKMQRDFQDQMNGRAGANQQQYQQYQQQYQQQQSRRRTRKSDNEGDVKVFKTQGAGEKKINENVGDYVDFEDIK